MIDILAAGPGSDTTKARTAELMIKFAAPSTVLESPQSYLTDAANVASNYADPFGRREYPIHTPASTWVSAAFYHANGSNNTEVGNRIKEACDRHRLFGEWKRLEQEARPQMAKEASATKYALESAKRYPIDSPEEIVKAATYFNTYSNEFTLPERKEFASNVAIAAHQMPGTLDSNTLYKLEAEGGFGRIANSWRSAFDDRIKMAMMEQQPELAEAIKQATVTPPEDVVTAAYWLRQVDSVNNWSLKDPLETLVDMTPSKAANELNGMVKAADGSWYAKYQLQEVSDETLSNLFNLPPVVSMSMREDLLKSASTSAAFKDVLADHGIDPLSQASFVRPDWAKLANAS